MMITHGVDLMILDVFVNGLSLSSSFRISTFFPHQATKCTMGCQIWGTPMGVKWIRQIETRLFSKVQDAIPCAGTNMLSGFKWI